MKKIDNPLVDYENKWVAMTLDYKEVIISADSLKDLYKKLEEMKVEKNEAVLDFVRPFDVSFAP